MKRNFLENKVSYYKLLPKEFKEEYMGKYEKGELTIKQMDSRIKENIKKESIKILKKIPKVGHNNLLELERRLLMIGVYLGAEGYFNSHNKFHYGDINQADKKFREFRKKHKTS